MEQRPQDQQSIEEQLQNQLLDGVQGKVKQPGRLREQLRDIFEPNDYVTIKNPFEHLTGWAYVDPAHENIERPDKTTRRVIHGRPQTRILQVGESIVIHGWEAYIALDRMFKEYAQKKGHNLTITLTSQDEIERFLGKAYGGVFDPNAQLNAINAQQVARDIEEQQANTPAPAPSTDPLGFEPEPKQQEEVTEQEDETPTEDETELNQTQTTPQTA